VQYASEFFNVSPRRIYEWVEAGRLAHYKLSHRTIRFSDVQLERFARSRKVA
jgi:excisionase family DNA binding protein